MADPIAEQPTTPSAPTAPATEPAVESTTPGTSSEPTGRWLPPLEPIHLDQIAPNPFQTTSNFKPEPKPNPNPSLTTGHMQNPEPLAFSDTKLKLNPDLSSFPPTESLQNPEPTGKWLPPLEPIHVDQAEITPKPLQATANPIPEPNLNPELAPSELPNSMLKPGATMEDFVTSATTPFPPLETVTPIPTPEQPQVITTTAVDQQPTVPPQPVTEIINNPVISGMMDALGSDTGFGVSSATPAYGTPVTPVQQPAPTQQSAETPTPAPAKKKWWHIW